MVQRPEPGFALESGNAFGMLNALGNNLIATLRPSFVSVA
jgi:hypothetical protein